jgi:hypothetical protein
MKIAILSWGSLIKTARARNLAIAGDFIGGGPTLPIEFSRVSQSGERAGCLTLVIDEVNGVNVPTQYAVSAHQHLDWALANLRFVENIKLKYSVGYVNLISETERGWARENHPRSVDLITAWARRMNFDAVIWTSLLSNFEKVLATPFTVAAAANYVNNLPAPVKEKAMDYIKDAPAEIITPVRCVLSGTIILNPPPVEQPLECPHEGEETLMRFLQRFRRPRQASHTSAAR